MNEQFGIEPCSFTSARDLRRVLEKFGFTEGRFLAEYPRMWVKMVKQQLDTLPGLERAKAIETLRIYHNSISPSTLQYNEEKTWASNAKSRVEEANLVQAFTARANKQSDMPTIDDLSEETLCDSRMITINGSAIELASVASALIRRSTELWLIDPYLDVLRPKRLSVLKAMLHIAVQQKKYRRFIIMSRAKTGDYNTASIKGPMTRFLGSGTPNVGITIRLVDDSNNLNEMHARYLLSMDGGLWYDKGFIEETRRVPVHTLSTNEHKSLCDLYIGGEHGYKVIDEIRWP
ncbi:hypothetical protein RY831_30840 [Noviherbaspirillum sp. CPCC 100848]|uniref:Uncharacterized protein n=1 Tax=Noviherbaspirillum album TaxID=3080276 RepID=A0ABU6JIR4_9BURK|nr:hypothetical protein [Noviherbaspirillum sp. CPCC 100848]MEC4723541.1 hypothetical protein [Noviherbaspirillum sp. CPCC 100848]